MNFKKLINEPTIGIAKTAVNILPKGVLNAENKI